MKLHSNRKNISYYKRKSNRFTFIELLVTIAIIAILAGMLLPALNSARGKARTIACMNTMKGFGMAGVQYAANFNECYVPYNLKNDCKWFSNRSFGELLSLPGEDKQAANYDPQYVRASAVCGEAPILPEFRYTSDPAWHSLQNVYGLLNPRTDDGEMQSGGTNDAEHRVVYLNKVKSPSMKFAFLEANNSGRVQINLSTLARWQENGPAERVEKAAYRHNGGMYMNVVFYDGHVQCLPAGRVDAAHWNSPARRNWDAYK